jgi:hypothetical protein
VGAAIALGSHPLNGNCALLVIAAMIIRIETITETPQKFLNSTKGTQIRTAKNKKKSPIRFLITVLRELFVLSQLLLKSTNKKLVIPSKSQPSNNKNTLLETNNTTILIKNIHIVIL